MQSVPYLKNTFQPVLAGVFRYCRSSPVREEALHSIQSLFHETEAHLKEPKFTRWLSHDAAVRAFMKCFRAVLVALGREATERKDPAATAYLGKISTLKFVTSLCMFYNLLPHLSRLSKVLDTAITSVQQLQDRPGPNENQIEDFLKSIDLKFSDLRAKIQTWRDRVRQPYLVLLIQCLRPISSHANPFSSKCLQSRYYK